MQVLPMKSGTKFDETDDRVELPDIMTSISHSIEATSTTVSLNDSCHTSYNSRELKEPLLEDSK